MIGLLGSRAAFHDGFGCVLPRGSKAPYPLKGDVEALKVPNNPPLLPEMAGSAGNAVAFLQVATSIAGVNEAAQETGTAAEQVLTAADNLSRQADKPRTNVNGFLGKIRAA